MNAIIYTRVSTTEQAERNKSLEVQEKACRDYAAKKDMNVLEVFVEEGESAKTADRTKLKELLAYCAKNKNNIDSIIVFKIDRLSRKTEDHLMLAALFAKQGIRLESATEILENTPSGKLMEHILASFAEFDNAMRSERSSKGMQSRLEEGGWVHKAPIGYKNIKDSLLRPTVEPDEMAPKVQRLLKDFSKGKFSKSNIAEVAAKKYGIKSKSFKLVNGKRKFSSTYDKPVGESTVYAMLKNILYAGYVDGKNLSEPIEGLHKHHAFITIEEYWRIQALLNGSGENDTQVSARPYGRDKDRWSLRRYLRCGYCKKNLTGSRSKGRNGNVYEYYHCTKCKGVKTKSGKFKHLTLPRDSLHKAFEDTLSSYRPSPSALEAFRTVVLAKWNDDYSDTLNKRVEVQGLISTLDKRKSDYIRMCSEGTITADELREEKDSIMIEKAKLQLELDGISQHFISTDKVLDAAIDFMANAAQMWKIAKGHDRVRFQNMAIPVGPTINVNLKFGNIKLSESFAKANLLDSEIKASKKTQNASESVLVISPRIELGLSG
jgi:site-specific DNA recombinase